ncbi:MAG: hypothetical protein J6T92_00255 [Ottowia sp.]|nr:hypothetical protein [Ottowia sp.]
MREQLVEQAAFAGAAAGVASKVSVASGTGTAVFGVITSDYFFAAIGALCALLTLVVNSYYKRKRHKLELRRVNFEEAMARREADRREREADVRMEVMRRTGQVVVAMDTQQGALTSQFTPITLKEEEGE